MDPDDQSNIMTTTIAPNHFLLSTNMDNNQYDDHLTAHLMNIHKTNTSSYKCCLCRKIVDDTTLTCAKCVNKGQFCSSKHDLCSTKQRQILVNMLNLNDKEEFQQYSNKSSNNKLTHLS